MASLKPVINAVVEVPGPLRDYYVAKDGKFVLQLDGEPSGYVKAEKLEKLAEFRDTNTKLLQEIEPLRATVKKLEGIDPVAVAADRARLAELEQANPNARVAELEAALAAERTARTDVQKKADRALLRDTIGAKALKAGALPSALDILLDKSEAIFAVVGDVITAKTAFSTERPGDRLSPDEWLVSAIREFPFLFHPSSGAGAAPRSNPFAAGQTTQKVLRDPTPQQLGQYAADIKSGKVRVESSSS